MYNAAPRLAAIRAARYETHCGGSIDRTTFGGGSCRERPYVRATYTISNHKRRSPMFEEYEGVGTSRTLKPASM
jgi:hypothetical protein